MRFLNKQRAMWAFIISLIVFSLNGCVYLVVGSIGAFGGYVVSPDSVEGTIVDYDYDRVWDQAFEVLSTMGMFERRDEAGGIVEARVHNAHVKVMVFRTGLDSVKVTVKARRSFMPKIKIAQEVYIKIVSAFDGGN